MHACQCVCMSVYPCLCMLVYVCTWVCTFLFTLVFACVCDVYSFTYLHISVNHMVLTFLNIALFTEYAA